MSQALGGRRGAVFSVRMTQDERARLYEAYRASDGPRAFGPWLVWLASQAAGLLPRQRGSTAAPTRRGNTAAITPAAVLPLTPPPAPPVRRRVILDLCAGSGAWSEPYKRAGYRVVRVTLPRFDVRTWVPPAARVWGVLAAPPCDQFSLARNGGARTPRDFVRGLEVVCACLRIILLTRPRWWALENPVGHLSKWLGTPRDVFEPCDFGDPWTKRTALWGDFSKPTHGPFVKPIAGKLRLAKSPAERARTPPGFARAFFKANP